MLLSGILSLSSLLSFAAAAVAVAVAVAVDLADVVVVAVVTLVDGSDLLWLLFLFVLLLRK